MKKIFVLGSVLALAACGNNVKYQETGLVCESESQVAITLDVKATDTTANVVVNGENVDLTLQPVEGSNMIVYVGTNANNEQVKLNIVSEEGQEVKYMLGVNSGDTTYGCAKVAEEKPAEQPVEK